MADYSGHGIMAGLVQVATMPPKLNLTDQDLYIDLKQYLETFCQCPVLQGYPNNVPPPMEDFVYMNILFRKELSMLPVDDYDPDQSQAFLQKYTQTTFQLDFYGESANNYANTFEILWKSPYTCDRLKICQPLNVVSANHSPIVNDTQNYEQRWIITANLQFNPVVTHDQIFIDDIPINISPVKGS